MSTLQVSPLGGVSAPVVGTSPTGEATATQNPNPNPTPGSKTPVAPARPDAVSASQAAQAKHATAAADAQAAQAAAVENARQVAKLETPSLNLSVGLVGGTFDVYVDLTDTAEGRVVARLYGPKGGAPAPRPQPRVRTEA
jgi:hypothetical protein